MSSASTPTTVANPTISSPPESDNVLSMLLKVYDFVVSLEPETAMGLIVAIGFVSILLGMASEDIISFHTILLTILISAFVYWYIKKTYTKELTNLKKKNVMLKTDTALDQLCMSDEVKEEDKATCDQYRMAKTNFYQISNSLIQKYNWKKE
jgi:hypothetical protein